MLRRQVFLALTLAAAPLALAFATHELSDLTMRSILGDKAAMAHVHPLTGALSTLGIMAWTAAAGAWFVAALFHRAAGAGAAFKFAMGFAALSLYLAMDDAFQIHENLAPTYLLIPEKGVYLGLCFTTAAFFWSVRWQILRAAVPLFVTSLGLLAGSVFLDILPDAWTKAMGDWFYFVEDGLKWLGIAAWCTYSFTRVVGDVRPYFTPRPIPAPARVSTLLPHRPSSTGVNGHAPAMLVGEK